MMVIERMMNTDLLKATVVLCDNISCHFRLALISIGGAVEAHSSFFSLFCPPHNVMFSLQAFESQIHKMGENAQKVSFCFNLGYFHLKMVDVLVNVKITLTFLNESNLIL